MIIGTTRKSVNEAWIDFYSIGHIVLGFVVFFVSYWFSLLVLRIQFREYLTIFTLVIAVLWELFENICIVKTKYKFDKRKDSVENSLFDIVFAFFGAIICYIMSLFEYDAFIIFGFLFMILSISAMEVCAILTLNSEDHNE